MVKADLFVLVQKDWGADSVAQSLLRCFLALEEEEVSSVTPQRAQQLCPEISPQLVRQSMLYFASDRLQLFELVVAVFDGLGDIHELESSQIKALLKGEVVAHPATGDPLTLDSEHAPFVFFRGTSKLVDAMREELV